MTRRGAVLLGVTVAALGLSSLVVLPERLSDLASHPREERLLRHYGECEPAGYGYLRRVLQVFPDAELRPAIRYQRYDRKTENHVEPVRFHVLPTVLVGIGFSDASLSESLINPATQVRDAWEFITHGDVESLTAFELEVTQPAGTRIQLKLFDGAGATQPLWQGEALTAGEPRLRVELDRPLRRFSLARGPEPFHLTITPAESVRAVRALGKEMDVSDHVLVHREGNCFVAFDRSWLDTLAPADRERWNDFAKRIPPPEAR